MQNRPCLNITFKGIIKISSEERQAAFEIDEKNLQVHLSRNTAFQKLRDTLIIKMEDFHHVSFTRKHPSQYIIVFKLEQRQLTIVVSENDGKMIRKYLGSLLPLKNFNYWYSSEKLIKKINNGQVVKCISHEDQQPYAVKMLTTNDCLVQQELEINQILAKHPHENILNMIEFFIENDSVYIIFPYLEGGTLYTLIQQQRSMKQKVIPSTYKGTMKRILKALKHIHSLGLMHRDIKMDNIMLEDITDPKSVKIIDFGFAGITNECLKQKCGTTGYFAPEILNGEDYNELCDIYSLAQVFHLLFTGQPMYTKGDDILRMSKYNLFQINKDKIDCNSAQDLLERMLEHHTKRLSAQQCLEHQFFQKFSSVEEKVGSLTTFSFRSPFDM